MKIVTRLTKFYANVYSNIWIIVSPNLEHKASLNLIKANLKNMQLKVFKIPVVLW